ncbi:LysR family transcriptional regulator [Mycobacterium sp. KBS0706]|uniref:LysR family transcriptional regulator n=1 Tax=Mycobacterium sp. KBS0706 TaxID=2578109 RepID=UPI00110FA65E|nr:LysR family transcriptional regulator [Mycobacterium sp. KBS0706]TSD84774.1 LysR family transcriptional regulator [Mycobacterium sp. KBS0706]
MRINPRQVEAFRNVMLAGGITAAAELMNVTQPAVSRLIRDFEFAVKLKLFEREGSRLSPRDEAVKLYREVERLYLGLDQIGRIAGDIRTAKGGVVRIGSIPTLSPLCANEIIPALVADLPDVSLVFDTESTNHITDMIASHQYDVGFVFGRADHKGPSFDLLATARVVAALPPGHRLAQAEAVTVKDLVGCRTILPGRKTPLRASVEQIARRDGTSLSSPIETSLWNCCVLASKRVGIGIVDQITALNFGDGIAVRPFEPEIAVDYLAITPPRAPRGHIVESVVERLKTAVAARLAGIGPNALDVVPGVPSGDICRHCGR